MYSFFKISLHLYKNKRFILYKNVLFKKTLSNFSAMGRCRLNGNFNQKTHTEMFYKNQLTP